MTQPRTAAATQEAARLRTLGRLRRMAQELSRAGWSVMEPGENGVTIGHVVCRCGDDMDRDDPQVFPDRDEYDPRNPLGTRGEWERIPVHCGCGRTGAIVTACHKGDQRVGLIGGMRLRPLG